MKHIVSSIYDFIQVIGLFIGEAFLVEASTVGCES